MKSYRVLLAAASVGIFASCSAVIQTTRKECTAYGPEAPVSYPYCAEMAPQTCTTNSAGFRSCYGGGYCVRTAYRTVMQKSCVSFECKAGYQKDGNDCFTAEEIAESRAKAGTPAPDPDEAYEREVAAITRVSDYRRLSGLPHDLDRVWTELGKLMPRDTNPYGFDPYGETRNLKGAIFPYVEYAKTADGKTDSKRTTLDEPFRKSLRGGENFFYHPKDWKEDRDPAVRVNLFLAVDEATAVRIFKQAKSLVEERTPHSPKFLPAPEISGAQEIIQFRQGTPGDPGWCWAGACIASWCRVGAYVVVIRYDPGIDERKREGWPSIEKVIQTIVRSLPVQAPRAG